MSELARIETIRADLSAIAPGRWTLAADGDGMFVEAQGAMGELWPLARFDPRASTEEQMFAASAVEHVRFLLGLVDRAIASRRASAAAQPAPPAGRQTTGGGRSAAAGADDAPDYAAEASIQCGKPAFKKFLMEAHGLESPATTERTAQKLRSLLGVTSRRDLNDDREAAERWRKLRGEFQAWRRRG